jgi:AcrR family transcriptional regulator
MSLIRHDTNFLTNPHRRRTIVHMNKRSGEETKKKILEVAGKVFSEYGYSRTNMRLVAGSAGISVGCLYLYFKNKEDLCLTLMKESLDDFNRETREALCGIHDPREALTTFVTLTADRAIGCKELYLLHAREHGFSFGMELKKNFFRERRRLIEDIIRDGVEKKIFRECNVMQTANVIFNVLRGFVVSLMIDDDALFSVEECVNVILNGVLARNA